MQSLVQAVLHSIVLSALATVPLQLLLIRILPPSFHNHNLSVHAEISHRIVQYGFTTIKARQVGLHSVA